MAERKSGKDDDRPDGGAADRAQDPLVERLRSDPSQPPTPTLVLEGLLGDSDRPGFRRLYFTRELDHYAEFRAEDALDVEAIPAERPPFLGAEATRVTLRRDAPIDYTRTRVARPLDEFDLDVQVGPAAGLAPADTFLAECPGGTRGDCPTFVTCRSCPDTCAITVCRGRTCIDVNTCDFEICQTRPRTRCDTCRTCQTCVTCRTCETCVTRCETCVTCQTCDTCATQCGTCETCGVTCNTCDTCRRTACDTCATCIGPRCNTRLAC